MFLGPIQRTISSVEFSESIFDRLFLVESRFFAALIDQSVRYPASGLLATHHAAFAALPKGEISLWGFSLSKTEKESHLKIYAKAYSTSAYGDGPEFAVFTADAEFLERLKKLQTLVVENKLSSVRVDAYPDVWGPGDIEDELRLQGGELVVTNQMFWFEDQPKHQDGHIETGAICFKTLLDDIAKSKGDEPLFYVDDVEEFKARLAELEEEEG